MNVQLKDITVTARDGRVSHLDQVYIRGSHVKFFIVPDMLRYYIYTVNVVYVLTSAETHPCSVRAASAVEVLALLVVRRQCRGPGDNGGVDLLNFFFSLAFLSCGFRHSSFLMVPYLCGIEKCDSLKTGFGAIPCDNRFSHIHLWVLLQVAIVCPAGGKDWTRWNAVRDGLEYH